MSILQIYTSPAECVDVLPGALAGFTWQSICHGARGLARHNALGAWSAWVRSSAHESLLEVETSKLPRKKDVQMIG